MEYIITFIFLLMLSAFFSGTETAYFHIRKHRKETPEKIKSVLDSPQRLLVFLLTGNTIVNVTIAFLAAYVTVNVADEYEWGESTLILLEVLVVSFVILVFGEILPKMIAIKNSKEFALRMHIPLKVMMFILSPIAQGFNTITNAVIKVFPFRREKIFDSEEELIILEIGRAHV